MTGHQRQPGGQQGEIHLRTGVKTLQTQEVTKNRQHRAVKMTSLQTVV